ncbi:uncharacterized protein LOC106638473 [Copidosoma floridanum]|uniref:uncharacterized protein LOC106638473 n=1 Tax=Copidosoma floridanum TaxID=29053 RepID=UPI0006C9470D|nr:uncharacterized protein LOC106638473 [Copidosoma floridanum]
MSPPTGARYKRCFVPGCPSDTVKTPDKQFFCVPLETTTRYNWFAAAWPGETFVPRQLYYCCQDHFNLKEDLKYSLKGGSSLRKEVVPHIFDGLTRQKLLNEVSNGEEQLHRLPKKTRIFDDENEVDESSLSKQRKVENNPAPTEQNNTSRQSGHIASQLKSAYVIQQKIYESEANVRYATENNGTPQKDVINVLKHDTVKRNSEVVHTEAEDDNEIQIIDPPINEGNTQQGKTRLNHNDNHGSHKLTKKILFPESPGINGTTKNKLRTKTKSTLAKPMMVDVACQYDPPITEDKACSPIRLIIKMPDSDKESGTLSSKQMLVLMKTRKNELFPVKDVKKNEVNNTEESSFAISHLVNSNPKEYIGIDADKLHILEELKSSTGCSTNDIMLTLLKIRMNKSFVKLARELGISTIQAITIFNRTVGLIANWLKKYVYPQSSEDTKKLIVDVLEVDVEKPLDPLQPCPLAESKKSCKLKYLISCSPDGLINFVSNGCNGTDASLFRESKIINSLPESCTVMANHEFDEQVEFILRKSKCHFVPFLAVRSCDADAPQIDLDLMREMSLRFNVEETMKNVRDYKILAPDAGLDFSFMTHVDNIVTIVAGLVNYHRLYERYF